MKMSLLGEKKGIYEFVLTKTVMFAFILGLVTIFYTYYNSQLNLSADSVAKAEADRIAKVIDNTIGFKGMSNSEIIYLKRYIHVGNSEVPYRFNITKDGAVIIQYDQYPYQNIRAASSFGTDAEYVSGRGISCTNMDLSKGAHFEVKKDNKNTYEQCRDTGGMCFVTTVKIDFDASESCYGTMHFEERYEKPVQTTTP